MRRETRKGYAESFEPVPDIPSSEQQPPKMETRKETGVEITPERRAAWNKALELLNNELLSLGKGYETIITPTKPRGRGRWKKTENADRIDEITMAINEIQKSPNPDALVRNVLTKERNRIMKERDSELLAQRKQHEETLKLILKEDQDIYDTKIKNIDNRLKLLGDRITMEQLQIESKQAKDEFDKRIQEIKQNSPAYKVTQRLIDEIDKQIAPPDKTAAAIDKLIAGLEKPS